VIAPSLIPRDQLPGRVIPGRPLPDGLGQTLILGSGLVATSCVVTGGLLLVVRRFAGAIPAAAEPGVLLTATFAAALLVLVVDAAVRTGSARGLATLARCGLAAGAAALLVPLRATTPTEWAAVAAAATVLGAVIVRDPTARPRSLRAARRRGPAAARHPLGRGTSDRATPSAAPPADPVVPTFAPELSTAGLVRQRIERRETTDGHDTLVGLLAITVSTGAKLASGHVGFCPSFRQLPTVEVTTDYDGVEAVVSVGELLPWGVRIDCRLAEPAEEDLVIPIMLQARAGG